MGIRLEGAVRSANDGHRGWVQTRTGIPSATRDEKSFYTKGFSSLVASGGPRARHPAPHPSSMTSFFSDGRGGRRLDLAVRGIGAGGRRGGLLALPTTLGRLHARDHQ